jgi:hypothetical protein
MIIHDPLYGCFAIPEYLTRLVVTPEVRRLSQISLVNTPSPSLPALGEIRRYSHTLGVLYLCQTCRSSQHSSQYSEDEWRALEASALVHDAGTPPFAHLLEYHLNEQLSGGWHHESHILSILRGHHAPENRAHQIFAGRTIAFRSELKHAGLSLELVEAILMRQHPLAGLLFGSIDLDNLDNVARMAWAIGLRDGPAVARTLGSLLSAGKRGIGLSEHPGREYVRRWGSLRRSVYEVMNFDPVAIAAQALLSEAIRLLVATGEIKGDEWDTDDELIARLLHHPATKAHISGEYYGRLPVMTFCIQLPGTLHEYGLESRAQTNSIIERVLSEHLPSDRVLGYTIIDSGTFSKHLRFHDPDSRTTWEEGSLSQSIILFGFVRAPRSPAVERCHAASRALLDTLHVPLERVLKWRVRVAEVDDAQRTFDFAAT